MSSKARKDILPEESYAVIGAAMEVHRQLGHGFLESVYQEALEWEFKERNIPFRSQFEIIIVYKGRELKKRFIADFVCYDQILLEIKALSRLSTVEDSQVLNYLKATSMPLGLLINFGAPSLEHKRFANTSR